MTVRIVTQADADATPEPVPDGPFGDKPEGSDGAFWADPVFWVTTLTEQVLRGPEYADGWDETYDGTQYADEDTRGEIVADVTWAVVAAMYGGDYWLTPDGDMREVDDLWVDHITRLARLVIQRVADDPGSRVVGDAWDGPILLADEPTEASDWWDVPSAIRWIRSRDYLTEYERSVAGWAEEVA